MHQKNTLRALLALVSFALISAAPLAADVVETRNGARIVGTVTKIEGGNVHVSTDYAGDLVIKQSEVTALTTDAPVFVRLASGTVLEGTVAGEGDTIKIAGSDGELTTTVAKVAATWSASGEDPQVTAMKADLAARERKWSIQTTFDLTGRTGNTNSTGLAAGFVATLTGKQDALKFYGTTNYASSEDAAGVETKTADEVIVGVDYSAFFSEKAGWYVRQELERDNVEDVDLRSTTDAGLKYRAIQNDRQELNLRLGAGYRFESYGTGLDNSGAVASLGLNNVFKIGTLTTLVTDLQYLPSIDDFADYRFIHDSGFEIPLAAKFWKLRVGVNNQFNSRPQPGRKDMDTTYYTRLILNWK
jgi:putative salt-induced outer membrane protein YdiY